MTFLCNLELQIDLLSLLSLHLSTLRIYVLLHYHAIPLSLPRASCAPIDLPFFLLLKRIHIPHSAIHIYLHPTPALHMCQLLRSWPGHMSLPWLRPSAALWDPHVVHRCIFTPSRFLGRCVTPAGAVHCWRNGQPPSGHAHGYARHR